MIHVRPGTGATVTALGSTYTTKTDGATTEGAYSLVEEDFWGDPTPLHRHVGAEEAFYVLSGRLAVWVDGVEAAVDPGAFVVVPRGAAHAARRLGHEPVRMLTLISPPGVERFFDAVVEKGEAALVEDPERLEQLAREFGTEIIGEHPVT